MEAFTLGARSSGATSQCATLGATSPPTGSSRRTIATPLINSIFPTENLRQQQGLLLARFIPLVA
ncbi:hypothetical protein BJX64DRAFT_253649 [Aspergillus heterothallicus]